ncbi:MAG: FecR family protein [Bacillota bacterium]|nr:FecR family protein [Bacillota bacterium]
MRRRPKPRAVMAAVALALLAFLPWWFGRAERPEGGTDGSRLWATLTEVRGFATIQLFGGKEEFRAQAGLAVGPRDRIRTGRDSQLELSFPDRSKVLVGPQTDLTIQDLTPAKVRLQLSLGRLWLFVRPIAVPCARFEVETPAAVIGVRGTVFSVSVQPEGTTRVSVASGQVEVQSLAQVVAVPAGHWVEIRPGQRPGSPQLFAPEERQEWSRLQEWIDEDRALEQGEGKSEPEREKSQQDEEGAAGRAQEDDDQEKEADQGKPGEGAPNGDDAGPRTEQFSAPAEWSRGNR